MKRSATILTATVALLAFTGCSTIRQLHLAPKGDNPTPTTVVNIGTPAAPEIVNPAAAPPCNPAADLACAPVGEQGEINPNPAPNPATDPRCNAATDSACIPPPECNPATSGNC